MHAENKVKYFTFSKISRVRLYFRVVRTKNMTKMQKTITYFTRKSGRRAMSELIVYTRLSPRAPPKTYGFIKT